MANEVMLVGSAHSAGLSMATRFFHFQSGELLKSMAAMPESYDVIVGGLGAMGSAAAFQLARRGCKVLGLDRLHPPHTFGSSHGQSRIIREAYFEHPIYVPIVQRAYELWAELAKASGQRLLLQTGGLMIGPPDGVVVKGTLASAQAHHLQHELLSVADVRRRFPAIDPRDDMAAIWEPRAGIVFPELCVKAHLRFAQESGAALKFNEPVTSWSDRGDSLEVKTAQGVYHCKHLVISAGSWAKELVPELRVVVERQVLVWFEQQAPQLFNPDRCPIYLFEYERNRYFYGFPELGTGVKIARHHEGLPVDANSVDREVTLEEIKSLHELVRSFLPELAGKALEAVVCLYTNMPDEHFLIDWHPKNPRVLVCSPCSGHGFKFSSAIGEIAADLILTGRSRFDLTLFRWR